MHVRFGLSVLDDVLANTGAKFVANYPEADASRVGSSTGYARLGKENGVFANSARCVAAGKTS